jgi:hypothetical protein
MKSDSKFIHDLILKKIKEHGLDANVNINEDGNLEVDCDPKDSKALQKLINEAINEDDESLQ